MEDLCSPEEGPLPEPQDSRGQGPFFQEAACDLHLTENSIPDEKKLHNARGKPQIGVSLDGAEEVTFKMI